MSEVPLYIKVWVEGGCGGIFSWRLASVPGQRLPQVQPTLWCKRGIASILNAEVPRWTFLDLYRKCWPLLVVIASTMDVVAVSCQRMLPQGQLPA